MQKYLLTSKQEAIETSKVIKNMVGPATEIIGEVPSRDKSPSEVNSGFNTNYIIMLPNWMLSD